MSFAVLLLAAGSSQRFGSPKQLATYRGKPLYLWATEAALSSGASRIVFVTRPGLNLDLPEKVTQVINPKADEGIGSSLSVGIDNIPEEVCVVALADQPNIPASHLAALAISISDKHPVAASRYSDGSAGVPAAFHRLLFPSIAELSGDRGAKALIKEHLEHCTQIPLSPNAQLDIDHPNDLV